jgi:hypothetical protein
MIFYLKIQENIFLQNHNFELIDIIFTEITPNNFQSDSVWINSSIMKIA